MSGPFFTDRMQAGLYHARRRRLDRLSGGASFFSGAALDMRFNVGQYLGLTPAGLTVGRASVGYADDAAGNWTSFAASAPRITDKGLRTGDARTNAIRNNSMQGAAVGTPGTLPTNWSVANNVGITTTVVGLGTENGVDYIDLRFSGTSGAAQNLVVSFDTSTAIAAVNGQQWAISAFMRFVANPVGPNSCILIMSQRDAGGLTLGADLATANLLPLPTPLTRQSLVATTNNASTAFLMPRVGFGLSNAVAYDFTVRFGWPQQELGVHASAPIRTTAGAVAVAADAITLPSTAYLGGAGTLYVEGTPNADYNGNEALFTLDDGTAANRIQLRRTNAGASAVVVVAASTVVYNQPLAGQAVNGGNFKIALAFAAADFRACTNGTLHSAAVTGALPSGINRGTIGFGASVAASFANIRRIAIFNTRLSDALMQALTT